MRPARARRLTIEVESFPLAGAFTISRGSRTEAQVVTVTIDEADRAGRGECVPYARYGESLGSVVGQVEDARSSIESGADRVALLELLPPGAARNALDAALWDLDARRDGLPVWRTAGLEEPPRAQSVRTLSLAEPAAMAEEARRCSAFPILKLKLGGGGDLARVEAVREAAPDARLVVDANEAWAPSDLERRLEALAALGVEMVEQPLPAGSDDALAALPREARAVPVGADESFHTVEQLDAVAALYDVVNLKLDKTGGLTCALEVRRAAAERDLEIMIGCMVGTSLAMAPALILAAGARWVDLDGPYLLARDRDPALHLGPAGEIRWRDEVWGGGRSEAQP